MTRITDLQFHHTDSNRMYAITAEGGLFVTTDKANNWTVKAGTENLVGSCASLCIDYSNDQTIWLGTGDRNYYNNVFRYGWRCLCAYAGLAPQLAFFDFFQNWNSFS